MIRKKWKLRGKSSWPPAKWYLVSNSNFRKLISSLKYVNQPLIKSSPLFRLLNLDFWVVFHQGFHCIRSLPHLHYSWQLKNKFRGQWLHVFLFFFKIWGLAVIRQVKYIIIIMEISTAPYLLKILQPVALTKVIQTTITSHRHRHRHRRAHTHTLTLTHTSGLITVLISMLKRTHTCTCAQTHMHTHTNTHACTDMQIHACMCTHTHTHTHTLTHTCSKSVLSEHLISICRNCLYLP